MVNRMGPYKAIDGFERYRWEIEMDTDQPMYKCPFCECRIIKLHYDVAVGTNGLNYCPYCGEDMRPEQQSFI